LGRLHGELLLLFAPTPVNSVVTGENFQLVCGVTVRDCFYGAILKGHRNLIIQFKSSAPASSTWQPDTQLYGRFSMLNFLAQFQIKTQAMLI
jgi:hypothetical protein